MKRTMKKLKRVVWSLFLSVIMVMEPVAGSVVVYAAQVTEEQGLPVMEDESVESVNGQEDSVENKEENMENNSDETDSGTEEEEDEIIDDGYGEDGREDSDESEDAQSDSEEDASDETGDENVDGSEEEQEEIGDPDAEDVEDLPTDEELEAWARETGRIPNGYHDVDYEVGRLADAESVVAANRAFSSTAEVVPASYDARDHGQVAAIRDQAGWGTCWSFSAVASAESAYKMQHDGDEANLSESQLVYFFYNGNANVDLEGPDGGLSGDKTTALMYDPVQQGGNSYFTTFALASWTGVVNEATDDSLVYPTYSTYGSNELSIDSRYAYADEMHLENAYWINLGDRDSVKRAIMEYGTVGVSYYYDDWYDSDTYKQRENHSYDGPAVYYNPSKPSTNHAVAIVGWDDDFDRNNFAYTRDNAVNHSDAPLLPEEDGAWLIRNNWGTGVSDGGYFWIPYTDASFMNSSGSWETAFAFDFAGADNYDHNYQYDGSNGMRSEGTFGGTPYTAAAVYTASGLQEIAAAGIGFASVNTDYTVEIYTGLKDENDPTSGTLAATATGTTSFEGFYTIDHLVSDKGNPLVVREGDKFSVVVTVKNNNGFSRLFVDTSYQNSNWISFTADTQKDKTFEKGGSSWVNVGTLSSPYTFRIKAYTNDYDFTMPQDGIELSPDMLETIPAQEYSGVKVEPEPKLFYGDGKGENEDDELIKDRDYTVTYENNDTVGDATIIITGKGNYKGEIKSTFPIVKKTLDADMISVSGKTYDGTTHCDLIVTNNDHPMVEGTDYTVKYSKSPLNAGTYTVTVTGKAPNYSGSAKKTFTIEKLNLTDDIVSLSEYTAVYTGKEIKPQVTVTVGENMVAAANYTVKYIDNKVPGTATVIITGKSNCQGTVEKTFTVLHKSIDADGITYVIKNASYTGSVLEPAVTIKDGKTTLKRGRDYELVYENNINATAEAKVTVTGIGNYTGQTVKTFTIDRQTVAAKKIKVALADTPSSCEVTVNGKVLDAETDYDLAIYNAGTTEPPVNKDELTLGTKYDITVTLKGNYQNANGKAATFSKVECKKATKNLTVRFADPNNRDNTLEKFSCEYKGSAWKPAIQVLDGDTLLTNKSYSLSYAGNVNAGTATITVTGKGEYGGSKAVPFEITKKKVDAFKVTIPAKTYTGKEIIPAVTLKDGSRKLKAGTDYVIDGYSDNVNAYGNPKVDITLKNYEVLREGEEYTTALTEFFTINPAKISSVKLGTSYYKGDADHDGEVDKVEPEIIAVKAGKIELSTSDYDAQYFDNQMLSTSKVKASVVIEGKGNFKGSKTVKFKITKEPLSKAQVNGVSEQTYKGNNIELTGVSLTNSSGNLIDPGNYTVSYKNNKKAGTASLTVKAVSEGIYSGSKTVKFKIAKAQLGEMVNVDTEQLPALTYTGSKLTFKTNDIKTAVTAKVPGDQPTYKVSYRNNINAGTAIMILTGSGNYQGTHEIEFKIEPRSMNDVDVTMAEKVLSYDGTNPVWTLIQKIVYGKRKLTKGVDYTLSYAYDQNIGLVIVNVRGIGNYTGIKKIMYTLTDES